MTNEFSVIYAQIGYIIKKCSLISDNDLTDDAKNEKIRWCCPRCVAEILPFHSSDNNELFLENLKSSNSISEHLLIIPNHQLNEFIMECKNVAKNYSNEDFDDFQQEFPNPVNSRYYDIHEFKQKKTDTASSLGLLHTNIASLGKHNDELSSIISHVRI